jgi:phospholipase A1
MLLCVSLQGFDGVDENLSHTASSPNGALIVDTRLLSHKKNYILFFLHDFGSHDAYRDASEAMFQLSLKRKLFDKLFCCDAELYFGYTQRSFWQIYDSANSRPFRETNYNPELFVAKTFEAPFREFGLTRLYAGYEHESNGQSTLTSRSWDRFYAKLFFARGAFGGDFKLWARIPESEKTAPLDPHGDDNPDIADTYGYTEANLYYDYYDHRFGLFLRKRAVELSLSVPFGQVYLYANYFNGYGESLIDYNEPVQKIGFGVQLNR